MTRTTKILAGASLVLALGVAGQVGYYGQQPTTSTVHASWVFNPKSVQQLQQRATTIALVEVVSTQAGPPIVTSQPEEPSGVDRIPTQRVTVEVLESYKGGSQEGQQLTLFQTGGAVLPAAPPRGAEGDALRTRVQQVVIEGDPLYRAGEQYLVMLEAGPQGTLRTVSPEGRYRYDVGADRLTAMVKNAVTNEVAGRPLATVAQTLRSS